MKTSSRPLLVASVLVTCAVANAQNTNWIAPSGSNFNDNASWSNNAPGLNTGRAEISPTGPGTQVVNINAGSQANDIRFSGGVWDVNGTETLQINTTGNNELRARFGADVAINVAIQGVGNDEFTLRPVNSAAAQTVIALNGGLAVDGGTIAKAGSGAVIFNSNIDGGTPNQLFVTRQGISVFTDNFSTTNINRIRVNSAGVIDTTPVTGGFTFGSNINLQGDGLVVGNVNVNGVLEPRGVGNVPSTLTFTDNLTTGTTSTWLLDLETLGASDFVSVGGDLDISGTLDITSASIGAGDTVIFADYGGLQSGTFDTVSFNGTILSPFQFDINPTAGIGGNQIAFTLLVPEVSSVLPITACMLPLAFFRRRSRKEV